MQTQDSTKDIIEIASEAKVLRELLGIEILLIGGGEAAGTAY